MGWVRVDAIVRISQNGRNKNDSGHGSKPLGWLGPGERGDMGVWLEDSEVSKRYTPPEYRLSVGMGPKEGRLARCVANVVSFRCFAAKLMKVELTGVIPEEAFSTVGDAKSIMCSRRLAED